MDVNASLCVVFAYTVKGNNVKQDLSFSHDLICYHCIQYNLSTMISSLKTSTIAYGLLYMLVLVHNLVLFLPISFILMLLFPMFVRNRFCLLAVPVTKILSVELWVPWFSTFSAHGRFRRSYVFSRCRFCAGKVFFLLSFEVVIRSPGYFWCLRNGTGSLWYCCRHD